MYTTAENSFAQQLVDEFNFSEREVIIHALRRIYRASYHSRMIKHPGTACEIAADTWRFLKVEP